MTNIASSRSRRILTAGSVGVNLNFTIIVVTGRYGSSSSAAYSLVSSQLVASVTSGSFTSQLITNAGYNGVTSGIQSLQAASISVFNKVTIAPSPQPSPYPTAVKPTTRPSTHAPTTLPKGAAAGIGIGVAILFGLVSYLVTFYAFRCSLIVDGLSPNYTEQDVHQAFPQCKAASLFDQGRAAIVSFPSHAAAKEAFVLATTNVSLYDKYSKRKLHVSWIMPFCLDEVLRTWCNYMPEFDDSPHHEEPFLHPEDVQIVPADSGVEMASGVSSLSTEQEYKGLSPSVSSPPPHTGLVDSTRRPEKVGNSTSKTSAPHSKGKNYFSSSIHLHDPKSHDNEHVDDSDEPQSLPLQSSRGDDDDSEDEDEADEDGDDHSEVTTSNHDAYEKSSRGGSGSDRTFTQPHNRTSR